MKYMGKIVKGCWPYLASVVMLGGMTMPYAAMGGETSATEQPFGAEDPFAVIGERKAVQSADAAPQSSDLKPQARAEVFFRGFDVNVNQNSRINPGNQFQKLQSLTGMAETRLTLMDYFDRQQSLRWLFKSYAAKSSYGETDRTLCNQVTLCSQVRVDEMFADWKGNNVFASIGKRRVNWGHAQGFNPVNVIAPPRDPLNPSYQTEGQPMIWLDRSGGLGSLDLILTRNYTQNWNSKQNRWGLRWGGASAKSDYAIYVFDGSPYQDGRAFERMVGASFSADVMPGMTLYMEAANFLHNYRNYYASDLAVQHKSGRYSQSVIGSSLDLGNRTSFFIEYLHNDQGYSQSDRLNYLQAADARLANGYDPTVVADFAQLAMNRNYLLANYKKELREKYNFNISALFAEDRSSSTRAEITYAASDYYEIRSSYLYSAGDKESEFGNTPYRGLFEIGIKASF